MLDWSSIMLQNLGMPSVIAHNYTVREVYPNLSADTAVGSALSEFARMYKDNTGEQVVYRGVNDALDLGIRNHDITQRTYDGESEVPKITDTLKKHLVFNGINAGAADYTSTLLADLMLDGALLDDFEPTHDYEKLKDLILGWETSLHNGQFPSEFADFVEHYFLNETPSLYSKPNELARLAKQRLDDRVRTKRALRRHRIKEEQLSAVEDVIDIQFDWVRRLSKLALERTVILVCDSHNDHITTS